VSYSSSTPTVSTIVDGKLHLVAPGMATVTASQAGNGNYNAATPVTRTFGVAYTWSGFLQPINLLPQPRSAFKFGSTVPVKFQLTGASANITEATATIWLAPVTGTSVGEEIELVNSNPADVGIFFRYTNGQYIYNLGTKKLSKGQWQIRVDLGDGVTTRTIIIDLKP